LQVRGPLHLLVEPFRVDREGNIDARHHRSIFRAPFGIEASAAQTRSATGRVRVGGTFVVGDARS
jgi:hypothetical protein